LQCNIAFFERLQKMQLGIFAQMHSFAAAQFACIPLHSFFAERYQPKSVTWSSSVRRRHRISGSSPHSSDDPSLIQLDHNLDDKILLSPPTPSTSLASSSSGAQQQQRQFDLLIGGGSSITGSVSAPVLLPRPARENNNHSRDTQSMPNDSIPQSTSGEILNAWDPSWDFASPSTSKNNLETG
jgi:hypothetical protein